MEVTLMPQRMGLEQTGPIFKSHIQNKLFLPDFFKYGTKPQNRVQIITSSTIKPIGVQSASLSRNRANRTLNFNSSHKAVIQDFKSDLLLSTLC